MFDYVKILIKNPDIKHLKSKLSFFQRLCQETGEYRGVSVADYHFCKIIIYDSGTVLFTGSIHKLWNSLNNYASENCKLMKDKGYNGNTFTVEDLLKVRVCLTKLLNCKPQQMIFQNVEIGVNVETNFSPNKFMRGLLYHKGKIFESSKSRNFFQSELEQYRVKVYNKGRQYRMKNDVLRIELHYSKMKFINQAGLFHFGDINTRVLSNLKELFLNKFDEIVYYDTTISAKRLKKRDLLHLDKYKNQRYWIDELPSNYRDRHKKRLRRIIEDNSENLKKQIRDLILSELDKITSITI